MVPKKLHLKIRVIFCEGRRKVMLVCKRRGFKFHWNVLWFRNCQLKWNEINHRIFRVRKTVGTILQTLKLKRGRTRRNESLPNKANSLGSRRGSWEGELPACNVDLERQTDLRKRLGRRDKRATPCAANCWPLKRLRWPEIKSVLCHRIKLPRKV